MALVIREYKVKDPRAVTCQDLADATSSNRRPRVRMYDLARRLREAAATRLGPKGAPPQMSIFIPGLVYRKLAVPPRPCSPARCFAIARVAGWLAHWKEQLCGANRIYGPPDLYRQFRQKPGCPLCPKCQRWRVNLHARIRFGS